MMRDSGSGRGVQLKRKWTGMAGTLTLDNVQEHALPTRLDGQTQTGGAGLAPSGIRPQYDAEAFALLGEQL